MFNFDDNNDNFEKLVKEYISMSNDYDKNEGTVLNYEIGKGWPSFTLADLEKATGLDGEEYGFNPNKAASSIWATPVIEATLPDFEAEIHESGCDCLKESHKYGEQPKHSHMHYKTDKLDMDFEYMRTLSNEITAVIHPVVCDIINDYDYEGSPIMGNGLDREFLTKLVDKAMDKAALTINEVKEIQFDSKIGSWDRYRLLRTVFETVILQEIFGCRRPNYRKVMGY